MQPNVPVRVHPSVLSADFGHLADDIAVVAAAGADALHLDVMDGHFVPNLSIGVPVVESIRKLTDLPLDTHLMITDPEKYAEPFAKAGADVITFHIEVTDEPRRLIDTIHELGCKAGVSLNPGTDVTEILDLAELVDVVLVMTVWPGFGGQAFMPQCAAKLTPLRDRMRPEQWLEVDGGIDTSTAATVVAAGADSLVAGSAVFGQDNPAAAVRALRRAGEQAHAKVEPTP
jgi:ribulose-phosphate 3-epimerase